MRVDLFVIDGQNDFLASGNEPADWPWPQGGRRRGSLCVDKADGEALNVAEFIRSKAKGIHRIHATLDCHHLLDCSHNTAWKKQDGSSPDPFTLVRVEDVESQTYVPRFQRAMWNGKLIPSVQWAQLYTKALRDGGRCELTLWPEHCVIQTWGASVYHPLQLAYNDWCREHGSWIDFITKGQYPFTEHYSAMKADVPDPTRPETQINAGVIHDAFQADLVIWTGWAGSHCLRWTALDALQYTPPSGVNPLLAKSVFVSDACAPVPNPPFPNAPNFEQWRTDFLDDVAKRGARVMTLAEVSRLF